MQGVTNSESIPLQKDMIAIQDYSVLLSVEGSVKIFRFFRKFGKMLSSNTTYYVVLWILMGTFILTFKSRSEHKKKI